MVGLLFFGGSGCGSPESPKDAALGAPFDVAISETAVVAQAELRVTFESVTADSRCPKGAQCIWEGDAVTRVSLATSAEATAVVELHTNSRFERSAEYHGYLVTLVELAPYPRADKTPDPRAYVATLRVDPAS